MQPHDPRPRKRAADRALWTYLRQHLGWLEGHPIEVRAGGVAWRAWPERTGPAEELVVDRERLRVAKYGLRGALRKFPRALPRVAGDVDCWTFALERRLEALARVVHDGAPLPGPDELASLAFTGRRAPLAVPDWCAADVGWLTLGLVDGSSAPTAEINARFAAWRGALEATRRSLGVERARLFAAAVAAGEFGEAGADLRGFLEDSRAFRVATDEGGVREVLDAALTGFAAHEDARHRFIAEPAPGAEPRTGPELVEALSVRPAAALARALGALVTPATFDEWERWWAELRSFERGARSELGVLLTRGAPVRDVIDRARGLRLELRALDEPPRSWSVRAALDLARRLLRAAPVEVTLDVVEAIAAVPDRMLTSHRQRAPARTSVAVCEAWADALECGLSARRSRELARMQTALASGGDDARAQHLCHAFAALVVEGYEPRPDLEWGARALARDVLVELWERGPAGRQVLADADRWDVGNRFRCFVRASTARGSDARTCAGLMVDAHGVRDWTDFELLGLLATVEGEATRDPAAFWSAAETLEPDRDDFAALRELARGHGVAALLGGLVVDLAFGELRELALLSSGVVKLGESAAPPSADEEMATGAPGDEELDWLPSPLRPAARELLPRVGWRGLDKVLRGDVVRPARIAQEVRALEERHDRGPHLEARLAALRERLERPPAPTPTRIEACRLRLERRLRQVRANEWRDALVRRLARRVPGALDAQLTDPEHLALIGALAALRPSVRDLAWRILDGDDLSVERAHVEWRARMAERGLDLSPWLHGDVQLEASAPSGRPLRFTLERDPMQVFQMGRWFDTCLAPGGMNFFSVVANAADENKQLLVARDARGVAQARCLLALTTDGRMLAFHVYAHEDHAWVRERFHALAADLARAMGTHLVPTGRVEVLVAPSWYDDGPRDLTGRLAELDDDGPLAARLREAPPALARQILEEGLGAEMLDAGVDHVVTRKVLTEDAERMLSLRSLLRARRLAPWAALDVALTVRDADPELARDVMVDVVRRRRGRELGLWGDTAAQFARVLAELGEPSLALRVLRSDDCEGPAADLARAVAEASLGRVAAARRLLEPLAEAGDRDARRILSAWIEV